MEKIEVLTIKSKKNKIKKILTILISFITIIIMICMFMLSKVQSKSEVISFEIKQGSTVYSVGKKLEKEGLIRNYFVYKVYVKLINLNEYKAGVYELNKNYSLPKIVKQLKSGKYKNDDIVITFKEGKTITGVTKEIVKKTNITEEEFYSVLKDEKYISSLIEKYWFLTDDIKNKDIYYSLEGYLYPETYNFNKSVNSKKIIETMLDQTNKVFSKYKEKFDSSSFTVNEIVTLSSVIEKEAVYDKDRNKIAGVFINRLNKGMPLGSDVTTYYAFHIELGSRDLTKKEINTYNPYNTRGPQMAGKLPVGAISNFGENSLKAALEPKIEDYYYFVADKNGNTHFTKTYDEHLKVIKELKDKGNWLEL